jgi:large subunit ribosomal protein L22
MKASLKNYRQTPRKTRLVTDLVKGKRVPEALAILEHANKRAAHQVKKLIESAVANAVKAGERADALVVKQITVDKGLVFTRFMARARGSASPIRKRTSRINVVLEVRAHSQRATSNTRRVTPTAKKP